MAGLMLALFLVALDQTVVGTALPKIIADLDGFEHYAWVTTAYLLASTAMIPVIGKLGDIYGRKWFIIGGVALFLAASALCGAAWGMTELILFRGLQGLGAGMIFANIFTSVADIFPDPARRAKYQGVFFSVFALTSVIGPTMGGWITDNLSWRWVFYVNLPLGVFSLFALPVVLHQGARRFGVKIDYLGAATITASVVSLLLALSWVGEGYDWDAVRVVVGFVVAAVLLAAFIPIEHRATEPMIPLSLFKSRGPLMPTTTLAVQSTVEKSLLGVATSATQFIRSLGSTVGTAIIGSLITSGYAAYLKDNARRRPQAA